MKNNKGFVALVGGALIAVCLVGAVFATIAVEVTHEFVKCGKINCSEVKTAPVVLAPNGGNFAAGNSNNLVANMN